MSPRPSLWGGGVIALFAGLWSLSFLSGLAEGVQFSIIGIVQGVILSLLGWRIYLRRLLPFSLLWLLVPSGGVIVPPLQAVTAGTAAWLLEAVGIPTFLDGVTLEVPSGSYLVAPACAGLNFVLAALVTALAYADLIYRGWGRRLTFVLALLVLAVAGNCLRVFLIIAIAHVTNNVGDIVGDHLLYGWGFFSLLLLAAMALGQRFRQDLVARPMVPPSYPSRSVPRLVTAVALSAALVAMAPVGMGLFLAFQKVNPRTGTPSLSCAGRSPVATSQDWDEAIPDALRQTDSLTTLTCQEDGQRVLLAVAVLERPVRQGKLFGSERKMTGDPTWDRTDLGPISLARPDGPVLPVQAEIQTLGNRHRLVWSLFWAAGAWRSPGLGAALADLRADLAGHRRAVLILAMTDIDDTRQAAERSLRDILSAQPLDHLATGRPDLGH